MKITVSVLKQRLHSREVTIGVIGLGYVGLPLAVEFARKGFRTIGYDIDRAKVNGINKGANYIRDLDDVLVANLVRKEKLLSATMDLTSIQECDVVYICVPTPFTVNKDPDISHIIDSARAVSNSLRPGQIVILKSTTFPGTTEKYVKPILDEKGLKCGRDYFLAFSPERIDPGNKVWTTANTPVVVGGVTRLCTNLAKLVNEQIIETVVPVSSPRVAEMEKLLENIFRSVNIALVNELAQLCDRIGINIWEVVESAKTKPFGFMPFYPGPGIGGHCILIDPYYLSWLAREYDFVTNFITLAAEVNESMPFYVRGMIEREIARQPVALSSARILIVGMAFKRDVDDLRHSPALKVVELLADEGFRNVTYYDPYIPTVKVRGRSLRSVEILTPSVVRRANVVVITTDHSCIDIAMIVENARVVIDTRNATANLKGKHSNIVLLGDGR